MKILGQRIRENKQTTLIGILLNHQKTPKRNEEKLCFNYWKNFHLNNRREKSLDMKNWQLRLDGVELPALAETDVDQNDSLAALYGEESARTRRHAVAVSGSRGAPPNESRSARGSVPTRRVHTWGGRPDSSIALILMDLTKLALRWLLKTEKTRWSSLSFFPQTLIAILTYKF